MSGLYICNYLGTLDIEYFLYVNVSLVIL
jgi:hypothetical protein